ncbi:MAG: glycosyltransferase family 39 protein, partial [Candidatus Acidiferrum sp.]
EWKRERGKEWKDGHPQDRLVDTGERWWLGVGAGIGLGMMAKYTMGFFAVGVVAGVLLTSAWRYLQSRWMWAGAAVAAGIFAPNLLWEWRRHFVSLEFLRFLHERDVRTGVTDWFLAGQVELTLLAFPLALAGLWFYFFAEEGKRWRALGWMYLVPMVLFSVLRGRNYYLAPGYPMLYAAGSVWIERKLRVASGERGEKKEVEERKSEKVQEWRPKAWVARVIWACLILDVAVAGAVALPIAPVNSNWWEFAAKVDGVFKEEIGWPEFVETVAQVRERLPEEERTRVGILAGNYGEAGALNLYGERYGLPRAISGVNSFWERGYGGAAPETLIVVGYSREFLEKHFASCEVAGHTWNRFGVMNEETIEDADIFVCRGLKGTWEEFWRGIGKFA